MGSLGSWIHWGCGFTQIARLARSLGSWVHWGLESLGGEGTLSIGKRHEGVVRV